MDIELVIMYKDLSIIRTSWGQKSKVKKDEVLFIAVSQLDSKKPRLNGRRHQTLVYGYDYYILYENSIGWYFLGGFDKFDFAWLSLENPWKEENCVWQDLDNLPPWLPRDALFFIGASVSEKIFKKAAKLANKEMH